MDPEERKVRASFKLLKNAVAKNLDDRFLELIDEETENYFSRIKKAATTADRKELEAFLERTNTPEVDKLYIFSIRTLFRNKQIKQKSVEEFMSLLLAHGLFRDLKDVDIEDVEIKNEGIAKAEILTKLNYKTSLAGSLIFIKDQDDWKVDLSSRLPQMNKRIKAFCRYKKIDTEGISCLNEFAKDGGEFEFDEEVIWEVME